MTVDEFCKWIESSGFKDGARLPSVRKVAASLGASTFTIFQAYKRLVEQGKIYGEHGNGYFWGQKPEIVVDAGEHETERLERLLLEDWKLGKISADSTLPSIKDLCSVYGTTSGSMSRTLEMLRERGVLDRKGRGRYYFKNTRSASSKLKEILLIMRCNPNGDFNCLGERELTFMQKVYAEARRNKLKVKALGYYEKEGIFLDAAGRRVELDDCRDCFGAVVSTMLVFNVKRLFAVFARTRFPISVWWEHPLYDIPRALKKEKRYAFFNLAFGDFPGRAVGHFLKEKGMERVAFISPYHMSMWSRDRLKGLKKVGLEVIEATDASHASHFDFMQEKGSHELFSRILLKLVKEIPPVDAWVVSNDRVGVEILSLVEQDKLKRPPYMVSFDNSNDSYRNRLDSFEFSLDALAEQSVFHLISPGVTLYKKDDFRELSGHVVEK
ncbi:GntR family transcriptional regulator [uncultured Fibrobacter sp.]|uniref:GntR family transcriptional regulator n=1 Tax=uncultured Fibrobacter sp. TaxID=261512 RepID=UPI002634CAE2|nr:GntR family transcriptional regulator [uncultured Fibrobacter sp.]